MYMQYVTGFNEPLLFTLCYMDDIGTKMNNYTKSIDVTERYSLNWWGGCARGGGDTF
jgi:hypothetical protein